MRETSQYFNHSLLATNCLHLKISGLCFRRDCVLCLLLYRINSSPFLASVQSKPTRLLPVHMHRTVLLFTLLSSLFPLEYHSFSILLCLYPVATQIQRQVKYVAVAGCRLGLLSNLFCQFLAPTSDSAATFTSAIRTEFSGLEGLLAGAAEAVPLVWGLTEAQLSVNDLAVVVQTSSLSSSAPLAEELTAISAETKGASCNLQKLLAQVQGTVDVYVSLSFRDLPVC